MIIIFGDRFAGKTDHVPGLFYVTTRFGHLFWFPLFPLETFVFLDKPCCEHSVPIGLSFKSALLAPGGERWP
jgi:hypothetical protein